MTNMLQKRMYFLVPYQLTGIQKGIQAGHAALEYLLKYKDDADTWEFVKNHKTWILLNGGTTNDGTILNNQPYVGTINQDVELLKSINYKHAIFREPDLGDVITAVCLICDERVFNKKDYPDFYFPTYSEWLNDSKDILLTKEKYNELKDLEYKSYVRKVGEDIAVLKNILNNKLKA